MSKREQLIIKQVLTILEGLAQSEESILQEGVGQLVPKLTTSEFLKALRYCDSERWLTSVTGGPFKTTKWSINDLGRAALLEMQ